VVRGPQFEKRWRRVLSSWPVCKEYKNHDSCYRCSSLVLVVTLDINSCT
jgi:hypothetical protein